MKRYRLFFAVLIAMLVIAALPTAIMAQTDIIFTFNGNAGRYGPGSELFMLGHVRDINVNSPIADTEATIRVLDSGGREIHYAIRRTDARGLFTTRLSVPRNVTGSMIVEITAAGLTVTEELAMPGTTDKVDVRGFVDSVGYLSGQSVRTTPEDTRHFGLLFTGNVNNYNNRGAELQTITGSTLLSVNERNRDVFTLFKREASGSFTRIASRADLIDSRDASIDYPIDQNRLTPVVAGGTVGTGTIGEMSSM